MKQRLESKCISDIRILLLLSNYFIGYMYAYPYLLKFIYKVFELDIKIYNFLTFVVYLFMIVFSIIIGYPVLKESILRFPKVKKYLESILLSFVALYFVSGVTSSIVMIITGADQSVNQSLIIDAFRESPLVIGSSIIIYAPIVEEIVFRGALFRGLRNRFSFIYSALISSLGFGFIHVFDSLIIGNYIDLWYLLTYSALGFVFCYSYEKNKTIYAPMLLHFMNNLLGLIGIIVSIYLV